VNQLANKVEACLTFSELPNFFLFKSLFQKSKAAAWNLGESLKFVEEVASHHLKNDSIKDWVLLCIYFIKIHKIYIEAYISVFRRVSKQNKQVEFYRERRNILTKWCLQLQGSSHRCLKPYCTQQVVMKKKNNIL